MHLKDFENEINQTREFLNNAQSLMVKRILAINKKSEYSQNINII